MEEVARDRVLLSVLLRICHRRGLMASLAIVALATGCATPNSAATTGSSVERVRIQAGNGVYDLDLSNDRISTRHVVSAAPHAVWAALPEAFSALGLQGSVLDPHKRVFGSARLHEAPRQIAGQRLSRFLSCGSSTTGPKADTYEVSLLALAQIDSVAAGTEILTRIDAVARPRGTSGGQVQCSSNGHLEEALVAALQARAGGEGTGGIELSR